MYSLRRLTSPRCFLMVAFVGSILLIHPAVVSAEDPQQAAELLPPSTIAYAELSGVDDVVEIIMGHPLRAKLESLDDIKKAYASKPFLDFRAALAVVEAQLGKPWREAVAELTEKGVYAGFDAKTDGAVLLIHSANEESLTKFLETFTKLARGDASLKGKPDPIKTGEYRGQTAIRVDEARAVQLGAWLAVTNKADLGKKVIDAYLDKGESFASNTRFKKALVNRPKSAKLWAFVDVETVRASGAAKALYNGRADNAVVELLVGGLLSNLQKTPYATMALEIETDRIAAAVQVPHQNKWTPEEREYFFGPGGKGRAPKNLKVANQMFTLSTYRNVSQMWLRAGDLFDEGVNEQLAQADSNLSTLFSGKDFGEDILGALQPELQLVVAEQNFEGVLPRPAIQLPSFAIVGRLREPEKMQRELKRIFQSLVGFLNVIGAMNGQPQLDLDMTREGNATIVSSQFAAEEDEKKSTEARINFNFSPSVAFHDDLFVVSSTTSLAKEIAVSTADRGDSPDNTNANADFKSIAKVLAANKEHLIAQNMLEDGNTREEAEKQIGILLSLMNVVRDAQLRFSPVEDALRLSLQIRLETGAQK